MVFIERASICYDFTALYALYTKRVGGWWGGGELTGNPYLCSTGIDVNYINLCSTGVDVTT